MTIHEEDTDAVRWGLHLLDVCSPSDSVSVGYVTHYKRDMSQEHHVKQEYCQSATPKVENDEMIAQALQEELSRLADAEAADSSDDEHQHDSVLSQDWGSHSQRHYDTVHLCPDPEENAVSSANQEDAEETCVPVIEDESILDGEVGRRLNQMVPVPHVPRTIQKVPSVDEATSDHQRLSERLVLYDLVELKVSGDGNCQFRSLSDQIYRTFDCHELVRQQVVDQLTSYQEFYEGYVPMGYDEYIKRMSNNGEWGDHVTLQAAADSYGLRIFVITSFKDTCYIEILPREQKSKRMITLSFWAEVHYNSIYPNGEFPAPETKRKKKWWQRII